jgi:hypothetical protein
MRRARSCLALSVIVAGAVAASSPSRGYNEDGHFYTLIALEHFHPTPGRQVTDEAKIAAFCTQMPDLARELDATTLRTEDMLDGNMLSWGAFSTCRGRNVRHMVTAHHYIHALTDSAAASVTDAAVAIIKALRQRGAADIDPNRACALGLGLHLLGDSFAHRRLAEPDRTYAPGLGHVRDNHDPDYIVFNRTRLDLWTGYTRKLAEALELGVDAAAFAQIGADHVAGGADTNLYNTDAIVTALTHSLDDPPPGETAQWAPYSPRLDRLYPAGTHILTLSFDDVVAIYRSALPPSSSALDYRTVWKTYMDVAIPEFGRKDIPSACPPEEHVP